MQVDEALDSWIADAVARTTSWSPTKPEGGQNTTNVLARVDEHSFARAWRST
jgi:hypothetical protein